MDTRLTDTDLGDLRPWVNTILHVVVLPFAVWGPGNWLSERRWVEEGDATVVGSA